ncbi:MAG: flagellar assembly protein FliW [Planctomycetota bacterium]
MDEQTVTREVASDTELEEVTFETLRFGEVTVSKDRIVNFPRGLVGLPDATRFTFLHPEDTDGPFFWMQALDDPALAFVVCDPRSFFPDYVVPLASEDQETLEIVAAEDGVVCVILVVPEDPRQITANLRGPVVINPQTCIGLQLVLAGDQYGARSHLFPVPGEEGARCSS